MGKRLPTPRAVLAPVLRLVPPAPLPIGSYTIDTIEFLESALATARLGQICGIAIVMFVSGGNKFQVEVAGNCIDNLALTRGAVAFLDDQLANQMDD